MTTYTAAFEELSRESVAIAGGTRRAIASAEQRLLLYVAREGAAP